MILDFSVLREGDETLLQTLQPVVKSKCISCMRCVAICPKHARKVSGFMTAVAGMAIKMACSVRKECELFI